MPFTINKAKNGQFFNVLTAKNGKVLSHSETMKTHAAVLKNIASQATNIAKKSWVMVKDNVKNEIYCLLINSGKIVEKSGVRKIKKK